MIVVDASAVIQLLSRTAAATSIEAAMFDAGRPVHVPHLLDVEVANVLRRFVANGAITSARGDVMLGLLRDLAIERHAHVGLLSRIWQLRDNVSAYDAAYVALAEALGASLLTCDARLARAVGHLLPVELV